MKNLINYIKEKNNFTRKMIKDVEYRLNFTITSSIIWNMAYAIIQLSLGLKHHSFWFYSLFLYYLLLIIMRFILVRHVKRYELNENKSLELKRYEICGYFLFGVNFALIIIIILMIKYEHGFSHHLITSIILGIYTLISITFSIINLVRYKRYNSLIYEGIKLISLASSSVSIISVVSTLTKGYKINRSLSKTLLIVVSVIIASFIISSSIYMILKAIKLKQKARY